MAVIGSEGVLAPGKWRWLRALGWMTGLCVAIVIGFNVIVKGTLWLLGSGIDATSGDKLLAAIAGAVAILLIYRLAVGLGERRAVPELGLRHGAADLMLGLAVGAAVMTLIVGTLWLFGWVVISSKPVENIALALRDSIRSGVLEELVLRLVIFRLLWRALGIWPALVLSAMLFGMLHFANPDSSLFAALCLAAGEGIGIGLYLITGRIWASIGMHAAWNFSQGWIFGAAVSGTSEIAGGPFAMHPAAGVSDLLTGGGFGPEASMAALVVSLVASAGLLFRAWKLGRFVASDETTDAIVQPSGNVQTAS